MRIRGGPADIQRRPRRGTHGIALITIGMLLFGCGGQPTTSAGPAEPPHSVAPSALSSGADPLVVGAVTVELPVIDSATSFNEIAARAEDDDRARSRTQAGFATEVGSGWAALSSTVDDAIDAVAADISSEFGVDLPAAVGDGRFASIAAPDRYAVAPPASAASALAIITAALTAGQALGQSGTRNASNTQTRTTTDGNDVATVTVKMKGTITSTGSRVVGDFTFDLTGNVTNSVSGATAQMKGSATARVEIDGCPDAGGSSKGKMSLSSSETVSGQHDGVDDTASWTRDLSGDFDIAVDDEANISGLSVDVQASESVVETTREPGEDEPETDGHELGVRAHYEYTSGPGFAGMAVDGSKTEGEVTHEKNAKKAHLAPLFKSAGYAIGVASFGLGTAAEAFWRGGKCVALTIDPNGGDVEADSITDVTATVKHIFEGGELEVPVEATLAGVAAIDPAGERQDAPATVTYTAGSEDGDVGEVKFSTVSKRGIDEETIKFTVGSKTLTVSLTGSMQTSIPGIGYTTTVSAPNIVLKRQPDGTYAGQGPATSGIQFPIADCPTPYSQVGTMNVLARPEVVADPALPPNWIVSWESGQSTTTGFCTIDGRHIELEGFTGPEGPAAGFTFVLGEIVVPAAGGTQEIQLTKLLGPAKNTIDATLVVEVAD